MGYYCCHSDVLSGGEWLRCTLSIIPIEGRTSTHISGVQIQNYA